MEKMGSVRSERASKDPETSDKDSVLNQQATSEETSSQLNTMLSRLNLSSPSLFHPGAKAESIIDLAHLIQASVMTFRASHPDRESDGDLQAFLQDIQAAASKVHSVSTALVASECVGEFIKFPKLPPKLRIKIWKYSLGGPRVGPRVVQFYAKRASVQEGYNIGVKQAPHVLFQVCRESRQVGLEKYSVQLSTSKSGFANTRIDPQEDILCFAPKKPYMHSAGDFRDMTLLKSGIWSQDALQLKRIAISSKAWNGTSIGDFLRRFKVVEEVIIVIDTLVPWPGRNDEIALAMSPPEHHQQEFQRALDGWWKLYGGNEAPLKKPVLRQGVLAFASKHCHQ